ncbi:FAD-binding oxidoreductase [Sphingomonas sp. BN140010]|uniref:FAD-binding oxidoreductase n=1 Tax=Sphingomonas arvum TaxID=2992113 RepID=A0ABT3JDK6_9SPHN|nr:FAD-binding oxidoreductase [Sphingomonas sp. BN140010]MCW3797157.1 FAD-binding oxidoreductase [Sphingomonas sp. BN140010]
MTYDVIIVGGGIAGASLGAQLAADMKVLIIEAEDLCGRHSTGRSAAFWQASLGGGNPAVGLSLLSKPMFDAGWPGAETPLLKPRGALHLTSARRHGFDHLDELAPEYRPTRVDRAKAEQHLPGLREQWTGAWWEPTCADIDVAAFHSACLTAVRRGGGEVLNGAELLAARKLGDGWRVEITGGALSCGLLVNAAGAWADEVARRAEVAPIGLQPRRRTVVQLRVGRRGLKAIPFVTDLHQSFYFKGEADNSVWVCPLDETPVDPCDAAPEELDVAVAIERFQGAVDWPVEAVERKWAGLRTFAPDRVMVFGADPEQDGFFWCAGQGGMGIQTAPAASLLCAELIRGEPETVVDALPFSPARFHQPR